MPTSAEKLRIQGSRGLLGLVCVVSVLLVFMALQNLPARLMALPGDDLRDDVVAGTNTGDRDFETFMLSRQHAFAWRSFAAYADDMAVANAMRASLDDISESDADNLSAKSVAQQKTALRIEPANSYGWSQLAFLDLQDDSMRKEAAAALVMSIETAPYEPGLMPSRLDMMMALQNELPPDTVKQIPVVARQAWDINAGAVLAKVQENNYVAVLQDALANDAKATERLNAMLAAAPQPAP